MAGRVLGTSPYRRRATVALTSGAWSLEPVTVATSFRQRLIGIHAPATRAVLLHAPSVHGRWLVEPLLVLHLSATGTVIGSDVLAPGGILHADAYWMLEMPAETRLPPDGARLNVLPSSP